MSTGHCSCGPCDMQQQWTDVHHSIPHRSCMRQCDKDRSKTGETNTNWGHCQEEWGPNKRHKDTTKGLT